MKLLWSSNAWEDYSEYWCHPQRKRELKLLNSLIRECLRTPEQGSGRPEPLKHKLNGWWSRRINNEDRLVYRVSAEGDTLEIASCRYHYE